MWFGVERSEAVGKLCVLLRMERHQRGGRHGARRLGRRAARARAVGRAARSVAREDGAGPPADSAEELE